MKSSLYQKYLLSLLLVILAFNYVDRFALGLLLQDIKVDLDLTDTQLGLLTGIAFAIFYSIAGIPIARWADRGNRATIIAVTCALWSAMVALCGAAGNFTQLMLIRVGVAVGEAGCIPPAHSLIADHFSRAERPRAVAKYMLGIPLAVVLGYFGAGWLNEFYGWRMTFILLGLPGLIVAVLAWTTLREPRRLKKPGEAAAPSRVGLEDISGTSRLPLQEICLTLWKNQTFVHLVLSFSVMFFFGYGVWQWAPAFFVRSHALQTGEIGTWFAVIWGVGGVAGTYLGGELASRYASQNERLQLRAMAILVGAFGILSVWIFLTHNHYVAFSIMAVTAIAWRMTDGPLFATIQTLVPPQMRALAIAIIYLFANLIGMGVGPFLVGALSDAFRPWAGEESLRYALAVMSPGFLWCAWHMWRASATVTTDLLRAQMHVSVGTAESGGTSTNRSIQVEMQ